MTVPIPTSMEEHRFFSVIMFLLRRLPRNAANFLDVSCGYKHIPYRTGWNVVHRSGPGPSKFWMYLSDDGSRVSPDPPLDISQEDIWEIFLPYEKLEETAVWKWLRDFSSQHSQGRWAKELLDTVSQIDRSFDDPPSQGQIEAAFKLTQFELLIGGQGDEARPKMIFESLLRKYVSLEAGGEVTSIILAYCLGELGRKSNLSLDGTVRLRQEFVEFIDGIIQSRRNQPPRSFGLLTHVASLYGFIAMKLSLQLQSDSGLPKDVRTVLRKSDAYVDERLVTDVQTHTIKSASPIGSPLGDKEILKDMGIWNAPEIDVIELLQRQYWPHISEN